MYICIYIYIPSLMMTSHCLPTSRFHADGANVARTEGGTSAT